MSGFLYDVRFKDRFLSLIQSLGGLKKCAEIAGVTDEQVGKWRDGKAKPQFFAVCSIADAANMNIEWLVTGKGAQHKGILRPAIGIPDMEPEESHIHIPRYDVHLSAGDGHWNEDNVTILDHIPFTLEFLERKLNRKTVRDLLILEASGDSMLPTISDGDLVLVDQRQKTRTDGIFAFVQDGLARVKRFRFLSGGKVEIVSDNRDIYSPEILSNADAQELTIIGRVRWIGHTV